MCFWNAALQIDATNNFSFLSFISKGITGILDGILKSLSLLEGVCDLTNNIKPPIQYIWTDYTDIQTDYWEKIHDDNFKMIILFLLCTKYQYFHLPFSLNHQTYS